MMNRLHDHKHVGCQPWPGGFIWVKLEGENQSEKGDVDQMGLSRDEEACPSQDNGT